MLEAAHQRQREGVDVVIGYVETHKRVETEALVAGLELIPPRQTHLSQYSIVRDGYRRHPEAANPPSFW